MIVFDLKCGNAHVFEVWFGSSEDYEAQRARGLVNCPYCGDGIIEKAAMAPRVSAKGNTTAAPSQSLPVAMPDQTPAPAEMKAMLGALARMQSEMLSKSQWVGRKFADKARAMHLGETDHSPIHGEVSIGDAKALQEEGVPVAALPFPVVPPEAQN
ncbi:DUF1178 family protein [Sphingobium boeckii]|uniref:DUF1178 family protein n=1 Tax=Sphingobium boeckii TaxID=1082345 RepID=A0A7W9AJR6_9SPHN|nr:DUF1178 family protein [Sphingobium boeckii]MBB5686978.1 hypothetical protein [Sphingobium boeckii]